MALLSWMQPREPAAALRTAWALCAVAVVITVVTIPLTPGGLAGPDGTGVATGLNSGDVALAVAAAVSLLVALGVSLNALIGTGHSGWAWAICPLAALATIVLLDLATDDASVRAQIFFVFGALYGGANLQRPGAVVMTAWSLLGAGIVLFSLRGFYDALSTLIYVGGVLVTTTLILVRSAERQARLMEALTHRASTDSLTGLVTRRAFDDATAAALVGEMRGTALILLDIDRFKDLNDRFGHPGGDQILVQLADLLSATTRRGDVLCRIGGDEIAVLLPDCSLAVANRRAQDIVEAVRRHEFVLQPSGERVPVSVSAGVARAPTHANDSRSLYTAADTALYVAKRAGRDRVAAAGDPVG